MVSWIKFLAHNTQPDYKLLAKKTNRIQLITLRVSHYVEFARWCLQLGNKSFDEHGFAPGQHVLPVLSVRIDKYTGKLNISDSACVEKLQKSNNNTKKSNKSSRATAVPVAVLPSGELLLDSWAIANYSGLKPIEDLELKRLLDAEIAPLARQLCYSILFKSKFKKLLNQILIDGTGILWRIIWFLFAGNYVIKLLIKTFSPYDNEAVQTCKDDLKNAVNKLDDYVINKKTRYLSGDKPGVSDIALASLLSPILNIKEYNNGKYMKYFTVVESKDDEFKELVEYYRNTASGQLAIDIYTNYRHANSI
mmetsp:Transcript_20983/g.19120  ORF Transcript_20983/g.19120 Transcript_20983/m.19120 type:complete len:307 (+) Transcript_20983:41-961(+)